MSHEDNDWGTTWEDTPVMKSPPRKPPALEGSDSRAVTPSSHDSFTARAKSSSSSKGPPVGSSSSSKVCVWYGVVMCVGLYLCMWDATVMCLFWHIH